MDANAPRVEDSQGRVPTVISGEFWDQPSLPITDEELTRLALGAGADDLEVGGAVAVELMLPRTTGLLSDWYMPAIATRKVSGWRLWVVVSIVGALLVIEALGLCSVFGQVVIG